MMKSFNSKILVVLLLLIFFSGVEGSPVALLKELFRGKIPFPSNVIGAISMIPTTITYLLRDYWIIHLRNGKKQEEAQTADPTLVLEHITFGEKVQCVYDLFNGNSESFFYGKNILGNQENFKNFVESAFPECEVFRLLKAPQYDLTGSIVSSDSFFGFISYNKKKKGLTIVFRGTVTDPEWVVDATFGGVEREPGSEAVGLEPRKYGFWETLKAGILCHFPLLSRNSLIVHRGFQNFYEFRRTADQIEKDDINMKENDKTVDPRVCAKQDSMQERVHKCLRWLIQEEKKEIDTVTITGHSLGAALAAVCALDISALIKKEELPIKNKVQLVTFACPKVAAGWKVEEAFKNIDFYHYCNRGDIVPVAMPGMGYKHPKSMEKIRYDPEKIGITKKELSGKFRMLIPSFSNIGGNHNLEHIMYNMWLSTGEMGKVKPRDIGLMQKGEDLLDRKMYPNRKIPPRWWGPLINKGVNKINGELNERQLEAGEVDKFIHDYLICHGKN